MIWDGRSFQMGRKVHTPEQIIGKLAEAEVLLSQGHTVGQVIRSKSVDRELAQSV